MSPTPQTTLDAEFGKYNLFLSSAYPQLFSDLEVFRQHCPLTFGKKNSLFSKSERIKMNVIRRKCRIIKAAAKIMRGLADSLVKIAELALNRIDIEFELRSGIDLNLKKGPKSFGHQKKRSFSNKEKMTRKNRANVTSESGKSCLPVSEQDSENDSNLGSVRNWHASTFSKSGKAPPFLPFKSRFQKMKEKKLQKHLIQHELVTKVIQESPIIDRVGRFLVDLSPHVAILSDGYDSMTRLNEFSNLMNKKEEFQTIFGADNHLERNKKEMRKSKNRVQEREIQESERVLRNRNNSLNQRTNQILGIRQNQSKLGIFDRANYYCSEEILHRLWKPEFGKWVHCSSNFRKEAFVQENANRQRVIQELNTGMCTRRPMTFEVPVMLNPGEFLSVNSNSQFSTDGYLDLHLQAIVESNGAEGQKDKGTQTEKYLETGEKEAGMIGSVHEADKAGKIDGADQIDHSE